MSQTSQEYFDRERESRLLLEDYLDEMPESIERLDIADKILWSDEVEKFVVYEDELDEDDRKVIDAFNTDRDWLDEAIKNYYDPLSIERRVRVNPRDPSQVESYQDSKYKILITYGWPNVFFEIDWTAELHLYRWGDHLTRDFGSDFADKLLSFYWLD